MQIKLKSTDKITKLFSTLNSWELISKLKFATAYMFKLKKNPFG